MLKTLTEKVLSYGLPVSDAERRVCEARKAPYGGPELVLGLREASSLVAPPITLLPFFVMDRAPTLDQQSIQL